MLLCYTIPAKHHAAQGGKDTKGSVLLSDTDSAVSWLAWAKGQGMIRPAIMAEDDAIALGYADAEGA